MNAQGETSTGRKRIIDFPGLVPRMKWKMTTNGNGFRLVVMKLSGLEHSDGSHNLVNILKNTGLCAFKWIFWYINYIPLRNKLYIFVLNNGNGTERAEEISLTFNPSDGFPLRGKWLPFIHFYSCKLRHTKVPQMQCFSISNSPWWHWHFCIALIN